MNTQFLELIFNNPRVFFSEFIIVPLPSVAFAYALVWWFTSKKNKTSNGITWQNVRGILFTDVISASIRLLAIISFAGRSAYEPSAETGAMGVYYLVIPAIIAYAYLKLIANKELALDNVSTSQTVTKFTKIDEDSLFAQVAKEMASMEIDEGLWTRAYAFENGDENKAKARYIRLRVEQLQSKIGEPDAIKNTISTEEKPKNILILIVMAVFCILAIVAVSKKSGSDKSESDFYKATTIDKQIKANPSVENKTAASQVQQDDQVKIFEIPESAGVIATVNGLSQNGTLGVTVDNLSTDWFALQLTVTIVDSHQHVDVLNGKRTQPAYSESYSAEISVPPSKTQNVQIPTRWNYDRGYLVSSIAIFGLNKIR